MNMTNMISRLLIMINVDNDDDDGDDDDSGDDDGKWQMAKWQSFVA